MLSRFFIPYEDLVVHNVQRSGAHRDGEFRCVIGATTVGKPSIKAGGWLVRALIEVLPKHADVVAL